MECSKDQRFSPFIKMLERFRRRPTEQAIPSTPITPISQHFSDEQYRASLERFEEIGRKKETPHDNLTPFLQSDPPKRA